MTGSYDSEYSPSLDVELAEEGTGFCLNLNFDLSDCKYETIMPSIIRNAEDAYLDKYYHLFGSLDPYRKCL